MTGEAQLRIKQIRGVLDWITNHDFPPMTPIIEVQKFIFALPMMVEAAKLALTALEKEIK